MTLEEFLDEYGEIQEFKPIAYFDSNLETLFVLWRDASQLEEWNKNACIQRIYDMHHSWWRFIGVQMPCKKPERGTIAWNLLKEYATKDLSWWERLIVRWYASRLTVEINDE